MTYSCIIPLIGGEALGVRDALNGQLPEYVLSYSPFKNHDAHYINYLRKHDWQGEYVVLDEDTSYKPKQVDVVATVCPCAGLSSLSANPSANNGTNDWLYTSANYVLEHIQPKCFWGENAPRLYSDFGTAVVEKLRAIGKKHGYTLCVYYTESHLHGIAQKRPRTFYFFFKDQKVPKLPFWRGGFEPIEDILKRSVDPSDPMSMPTSNIDFFKNGWLMYCMHKHSTTDLAVLQEKTEGSSKNVILWALSLAGGETNIQEIIDWTRENGFEKTAKRAEAIQAKILKGENFWSHDILIPSGKIPSFVGVLPVEMVNPFRAADPRLTVRDCLRIMKMPDDFELVGDPIKNLNHICQNVPVTTARDMMKGVIKYMHNELDLINCDFLKLNNKTEAFIYTETETETYKLL